MSARNDVILSALEIRLEGRTLMSNKDAPTQIKLKLLCFILFFEFFCLCSYVNTM